MEVSPWHIIELLVMGILGLFMWTLRSMHQEISSRVRYLENNTVSKETMSSMTKLMEEHRNETRNQFNEVQKTLNTILLKVGNHD